jgi:hypothetical protein
MHSQTIIDHLTVIKEGLTAHDRYVIEEACEAIKKAQQAEPLGRKLAGLLDVAIPFFEKEAAKEKRQEAGKTLRCCTWQSRTQAAQEHLNQAKTVFNYDL